MRKLEEDILRTFFRLEEYQEQRKRMERLLHPEKLKWAEGPPPLTRTKQIRIEELAKIGFGESFYQRMLEGEEKTEREFKELVELHPLWPHWERIKGLGLLLCGKFIAAAGDVEQIDSISSFWAGMGLKVNPDGTVPRRIRGKKGKTKGRIPALPHVTKVGEQIRQAILRSDGKLRGFYDKYRERYDSKYPDRQAMFNFKGAQRIPQKILYACSLVAWRDAYGLPTKKPYAIEILKHGDGNMITIEDLYDK